jgi:hypothetical protein
VPRARGTDKAQVGEFRIVDCAGGARLTVPAKIVSEPPGVPAYDVELADPYELADLLGQYLRARGRRPGKPVKTRKPRDKKNGHTEVGIATPPLFPVTPTDT